MTVLLWLGVSALALVALAWVLRAVGSRRWAGLIRTHTGQLEAGAWDVRGRPAVPARFDARELDGLPAPVQRYFRAVLTDGQPIIAAASIEMTGRINLSTAGEQWKPFTSHQRVVTGRPGFLWDARVDMFPGVPVQVEDSYQAGHGRLVARLFGLFTVAASQGDGEIARGECMRYWAESPWYPTALLPSQGVRWAAVDERAASATFNDGAITLTLLFRFDAAGLVASVGAEARGAARGKDGAWVMLPWDCALSDYQPQGGMLIPMTGEAAWVRPEGRRVYFRGHVKTLAHGFRP